MGTKSSHLFSHQLLNRRFLICSQHGQTSLEGLLILPVGILSVGLLIWSVAFGWSYFWLRYQLHETVICLQDLTPNICKDRFYHNVRSATPYVQVQSLDLFSTGLQQRGSCHIKFSFIGKHTIYMEKTITR